MPTPILLTSLALLVVPAAVLATQAPPSQVRAQAERVVAVINQGDSAAISRFVATQLSARARQQRPAAEFESLLRDLHRQSGGVTIRTTEPFGQGVALTLWARNADKGVFLYVARDREDVTRLGRLQALRWFHPQANVRTLPAIAAGEAAFFRALHDEVSRLTTAGEFSGTIAIARRGQVVFEQGFGVADRATGEQNGAETRFHLASVGKSFTAAAVGQLIDAGRLRWDDSLGVLLPLLPWSVPVRAITVRQLLGHTSGLGQAEHAGRPIDSAFAATPPAFAPGSRFSYSNDGYEILGLIIERLTGHTWQDYVRAQILVPSRMSATDAYLIDLPLAHRAVGYGHRDDDYFGSGALVPNTGKVTGRGTAAGGSYGTARDLLGFADALVAGRPIRRSTLDTLTVPRWPLPGPYPDEHYGYGFAVHDVDGARVIGHAGGGLGWGICSRWDALADGSYSVAVLSNYDPPECEEISRAILVALAPRR